MAFSSAAEALRGRQRVASRLRRRRRAGRGRGRRACGPRRRSPPCTGGRACRPSRAGCRCRPSPRRGGRRPGRSVRDGVRVERVVPVGLQQPPRGRPIRSYCRRSPVITPAVSCRRVQGRPTARRCRPLRSAAARADTTPRRREARSQRLVLPRRSPRRGSATPEPPWSGRPAPDRPAFPSVRCRATGPSSGGPQLAAAARRGRPTSTAQERQEPPEVRRLRVGSKTYSYHCLRLVEALGLVERLRDEQRRVEEVSQ